MIHDFEPTQINLDFVKQDLSLDSKVLAYIENLRHIEQLKCARKIESKIPPDVNPLYNPDHKCKLNKKNKKIKLQT